MGIGRQADNPQATRGSVRVVAPDWEIRREHVGGKLVAEVIQGEG
jgi:hypothetical protein